jgi:hypothetical protein
MMQTYPMAEARHAYTLTAARHLFLFRSMPEQYGPKAKNRYLLSDAERNGSFAHMRCRYCKTGRYYLLSDLRKIFGNIECDHVTDNHVWRCMNCRKTHTIDITLAYPSALERQTMKVRRLDRIEYVRRIFWRDE